MAVKKKVVDIDTGKALKSVKSMREELKLLKDLLVTLDKGTLEYAETLQKAANISHDLKEMNQELAASAMDFGQIMGNITKTVGGVVSGFQALSASMTLLGIENSEALELIKKLQALMALTQGIAGVENGIKAFKRLILAITNSTTVAKLFNKATAETAVSEQAASASAKGLQGAMIGEATATKTATIATQAFKKALISTGIGAIIIAVGILIANLDKLAKIFVTSAKEAEKLKKQTADFNKAVSDANSNTVYFEGQLKKVQASYKPVLNSLKQHIETLKTQGKSQSEIEAAEDAYHAKYMQYLDQEQKAIKFTNDKLAETINANNRLQGELGKDVNEKNVYAILANYQRLVIQQTTAIADAEEKGDKAAKTRAENNIKRYNGMIEMLKQYAKGIERIVDIEIEVSNEEEKTNAERAARRKKLKEDLEKFDEQMLIDGLKNKDKELAQVNKAEKERAKALKEYYKQGAMSKAEYEKRLTEITNLYNAQRTEIEAKWAQDASKKREEILKSQFEIERKEYDRQRTDLSAYYKLEHEDNAAALRNRSISIIEYYNKEKEIITNKMEEERSILDAQYLAQTDFISEQLDERFRLLGQEGLTDEERTKLTTDIAELTQQLSVLETQHAADLVNLATETNNTIAELNQATIEEQMEALRTLTENVVGAMDAITGIGTGLSSEWASAFDTMANGLINLGQKIKEGGAQWQDYAQLAVAAFQAAGLVMSALADQQETDTKEGFEQLKKYQIAAVTMNMLGGIISAWTSALNPANAWMTIYGQLAMGAATTAMMLATGIMQIQKISQQQFDGGTSVGASGSAMQSITAPVQYTQDVQGADIEGAIKDSRVYVVESDITNAQNRVDVTESEARY